MMDIVSIVRRGLGRDYPRGLATTLAEQFDGQQIITLIRSRSLPWVRIWAATWLGL
jgi:hypothetical protein